MKKVYSICCLLFAIGSASAQTPNFSEHIALIIYDNCTPCHRDNGIAPFPLESYWDVYNERYNIANEVALGEMPPWPPDTAYQRYAHERVLTQAEKNQIIAWVNANGPRGDSTLAPCAPEFPDDGFLGAPDLKLTIPTYTSNATASSDDYVCFSLPTGLNSAKIVKALEVVPGNSAIVHHVIIYVDETGTYQTNTSGNCMGPGNAKVLGGYAPGSLPNVFVNSPNTKMGVTIPAGANIVLAMHFPEGSAGQQDSTSINLYFYPDTSTSVREVSVAPFAGSFNFTIPANTVTTISENSGPIPGDISALSVFPHMHLLGKSIIAFAVTPSNDTLPLINIPEWDFEWQDFYTFINPVKIPAGSIVYSDATYDNTTNNHHNPNNPPQDVHAGLNTTDEMFILSLQYTLYQTGDENIDLEGEPPAIALTGNSSFCAGSSTTLAVNTTAGGSPVMSYEWCPDGPNAPVNNINTPGAYYVEVTFDNGQTARSNTIVVNELNPAKPVITEENCILIATPDSTTITISFQWKVNGGNNIGTNSPTLTPGVSGFYTVMTSDTDGCIVESEIYEVQLPWVAQPIALDAGWNMISSYVAPNEPDMLDVVSNIASDVLLVKNSLGDAAIPSLEINAIGDWMVEEGYKLKAADATTLVIGCEQVDPTTTPISVPSGWSIIAYLRTSDMDVATALSTIAGDILLVKDVYGNSYIPSLNINTIGDMTPGQGYKVKMANAVTLTYPGN